MDNKTYRHDDCRNFATIDAAKGICRKTNEIIFTDTDVCEALEQIPKCKNCNHFKNSDKDDVGTCTGLETNDWTYGELSGINCEGYSSK